MEHNPEKAKYLIAQAMCEINHKKNEGWQEINNALHDTKKRMRKRAEAEKQP